MRWAAVCCLMAAGFSAAHGQEAERSAVALQPGSWETKDTITDVGVAGMSDEQASAMRRALRVPRTQVQCITPEQAAEPLRHLLTNQLSCSFTRDIFAGGTIDIAGTCRPPDQPGEVQITTTGTYTSTTITANFQPDARAPQAGSGGSMTLRLSGALNVRRTGSCQNAQ